MPVAKSPAFNPPIRAQSFSEVPDLQNGPGASADAIEIVEKPDRRSRNVEDIISMLDEFGVTGAPQSEDVVLQPSPLLAPTRQKVSGTDRRCLDAKCSTTPRTNRTAPATEALVRRLTVRATPSGTRISLTTSWPFSTF